MIEEEQGHRKFLKGGYSKFKPGVYAEEKFKLFPDGDEYDFTWTRNVKCATMAFIVSLSCAACDMSVIEDFMHYYPDFDYQLFVYGDDEDLLKINNDYKLAPSTRVHLFDMVTLDRVFQFGAGVPWVVGINNEGQMISGGSYNKLDRLEMIMRPFIRVFYPEMYPNIV